MTTDQALTAAIRGLTRRELSVLVHILDGKSAREIARDELLSVHTVRNQTCAVLVKLGVTSQIQAVARVNRLLHGPAHHRRLLDLVEAQ